MEDKKLNNIENIIEELKSMSQQVTNFRKFDGISIECTKAPVADIIASMNEMKALSQKLKLMPVSTEKRKDDPELFLVQYPELVPQYTDEQVIAMYKDTFNFLFTNIKMKDPKAISKSQLIDNMDRLVKHAIMTYCRSNINQYKEHFDEYYNNKKYRAKINGIFLESVEEFL